MLHFEVSKICRGKGKESVREADNINMTRIRGEVLWGGTWFSSTGEKYLLFPGKHLQDQWRGRARVTSIPFSGPRVPVFILD